MFGIFAKGKAARLGLQIKNWFKKADGNQPIKAIPEIKRIIANTDTTTRTSLRVKRHQFKNDKRMPLGTRMFVCGQGYFMKREGYTAFSGPCPTPAAAQRTALKNMGAMK